MAIDLSDMVDALKREVNSPGAVAFPNATNSEYVGHLTDAFWQAKLDGLFTGYTEADGFVSPESGDTEFTMDLQYLVVLYAGMRIVRNQLRELNTTFRAKAGPVEYETQKSAQVLKAILDDLRARLDLVLVSLTQAGATTDYYIDAVAGRDESIDSSLTYWVM